MKMHWFRLLLLKQCFKKVVSLEEGCGSQLLKLFSASRQWMVFVLSQFTESQADMSSSGESLEERLASCLYDNFPFNLNSWRVSKCHTESVVLPVTYLNLCFYILGGSYL